jgi:hypothetical protein
MTARTVTLVTIVFVAGACVGAVLQRQYGVGNLLRAVGVPYPITVTGAPAIPVRVAVSEEHQGRLSLFILAGQSNMSGAAEVPQQRPSDPRIYLFGNDYAWREAVEPIDDAYRQVDEISEDRAAGMGPSLAFATALLREHPNIAIGLIPCAKWASGILEWQRNLSDRSLYGSCLKRARAASPMGRIAGLLFFQGENEAEMNPKVRVAPAAWGRLFADMVASWRRDLQEEGLPVVFAQVGAIGPLGYPHLKVVQAQQRAVALPRVAMITTDDLELLDGVHFTAESYRTIGERFARAYVDLQ